MSICVPLNETDTDEFEEPSNVFVGSYCADILMTMSVDKVEKKDNYL
jgi:hypothetical protein